jgi:hypothetical protein
MVLIICLVIMALIIMIVGGGLGRRLGCRWGGLGFRLRRLLDGRGALASRLACTTSTTRTTDSRQGLNIGRRCGGCDSGGNYLRGC